MSGKKFVFSFKDQLELGARGEAEFLTAHPKLERLDGRNADFKLPDGRLLELKSDSYNPAATPNFFMERFSSFDQGTPGGPWQALSKNIDLFVYRFAMTGEEFWFETSKLVEHLERSKALYRSAMIPNKGWQAMGYLVPRASLSSLRLETPKEEK